MLERSRRTEGVAVIKARSLEDRDGRVAIGGRILARLINEKTGQIQEIEGHNLITSAGDVHYAERATTKTPTLTFTMLQLSTVGSAIAKDDIHGDLANYIAGSSSIVVTGYPANGDTDPDNSGSGNAVISWRFAYAKADFNSGVVQGVIVTTSPTSDSELLTHFAFATTFTKTSDDTLVVFVNHTVLGTS